MSDLRHLTWRAGGLVVASLCLLLYFPWGLALHTGIAVPDTLGWAIMGLLFLSTALTHPLRLYRSTLLLSGALLLTLPLAWAGNNADLWRAGCRVAVLWGGVAMVSCLGARAPTPEENLHRLAWGGVIIGCLCALSVLVRMGLPTVFARWQPLAGGGWAPGGVLQPDMMSLALAVALLAALHLWLFLADRRVLLPLVLMTVALTLCLRLSGLTLLALGGGVMLFAGAPGLRRRLLFCILLVLTVSLAVWVVLTHLLPTLLKPVWPSEWARLPAMARACLALLTSHPLLGVGYGQFGADLPDVLGQAGLDVAHSRGPLIEHPGSELLYGVTEGGGIALAGLLLLLVWGGRLLVVLWRQARRVGGYGHAGSAGLSLLVVALPLGGYALAGTVWYQSPLHYLLFVGLLGLAVTRLPEHQRSGTLSSGTRGVVRGALTLAGLGTLAFALAATGMALALQQARQVQARDVTSLRVAHQLMPWYQPDDVNLLLTVNRLQQTDPGTLHALPDGTTAFLGGYLYRHPDPNVYSQYITILDHLGNDAEAERVYQDGQRRVPWDPRFTPDTPASVSTPPVH